MAWPRVPDNLFLDLLPAIFGQNNTRAAGALASQGHMVPPAGAGGGAVPMPSNAQGTGAIMQGGSMGRGYDNQPGQPMMPPGQSAGANAQSGGANAATGAVRDAGAPVNPGGQPVSVGNPQGAAMVRYNPSNPQFAMQSAMQDLGMNPFRANPFMAMTMKAAPGLAQAFDIANVGTGADTMAARGGEGAMFGDYLRAALTGQGGASIMDPIRAGAAALPGALNQVTAQQNALNASGQGGGTAGQGLGDVNPFMGILASIYGDPQAAAGAYGALGTPFMSSGTGQAYQQGLGNVASQALRREGNDYGQNINVPNFWQYLFPNT
jgi:hypothetical protein